MGTLYYRENVGSVMCALMEFLGPIGRLTCLAAMALCLVEIRRALEHTRSLYLHCDPTAADKLVNTKNT